MARPLLALAQFGRLSTPRPGVPAFEVVREDQRRAVLVGADVEARARDRFRAHARKPVVSQESCRSSLRIEPKGRAVSRAHRPPPPTRVPAGPVCRYTRAMPNRKREPQRKDDVRAGGKNRRPAEMKGTSDPDTEALVDRVFPLDGPANPDLSRNRVFAIIPKSMVDAGPEAFASYLEEVFEAGDDIDQLLDALAGGSGEIDAAERRLKVIIPADILRDGGLGTVSFLERVFRAFQEIESVISDLNAQTGDWASSSVTIKSMVLSNDEVANPDLVLGAVDRAESEREKLELLMRQARHTLKRLSRFRLSETPPGALVGEIRARGELRTVQYLIDFLRSVHVAADSFEQLEIPKPHIRDYLESLYRMEDWDAMGELVKRLEHAVRRFVAGSREAERTP